MKRPTIRSKQPCPVCGGREWYPLCGATYEEPHRMAVDVGLSVAFALPVIDQTSNAFCYDECARCHIVVC